MTSSTRRGGVDELQFHEVASDPASQSGQGTVYMKDAAGVTQLFVRVGDGTIYQLTPVITFLDSGVPIPGAPHKALSFDGAGVLVNDLGGGLAQAIIPGNAAYLPEQWVQLAVLASQTNVAMATKVSVLFVTFKAVRGGSITGLVTRLTQTITAGTLVVDVTINGALSGPSLTHTAISNQDGGVTTEGPGVVAYNAGDLIGVRFSTTAGFLPITTNLEAAVSVFEGA